MLERFLQPLDMEEACVMLRENQGKGKLVAGATDFLNELHQGRIDPDCIIDLSKLGELKNIGREGEELRIGAGVTMSELEANEEVGRHLPALTQAAGSVGAKQTRNRATIGGNVVGASPGADLLSALSAFDVTLILRNQDSNREIRLENFILGAKWCAIANDEILVEVRVKIPQEGTSMKFRKLSRRNAASVSLLNITCMLGIKDKLISDVRLAMGAVLPTARRYQAAEQLLLGKSPTLELFYEAGRLAKEQVLCEADPDDLDDLDLGYEYKLKVLPNLVSNMLLEMTEMEA